MKLNQKFETAEKAMRHLFELAEKNSFSGDPIRIHIWIGCQEIISIPNTYKNKLRGVGSFSFLEKKDLTGRNFKVFWHNNSIGIEFLDVILIRRISGREPKCGNNIKARFPTLEAV